MKKAIFVIFSIICIVSLFHAGIIDALVLFLITGAIPGTSQILSPVSMAIILAIACFGGIIVLLKNENQLLVEPQLIKSRPVAKKEAAAKKAKVKKHYYAQLKKTILQKTRRFRRQLHRRWAKSLQPKVLTLRGQIVAAPKARRVR